MKDIKKPDELAQPYYHAFDTKLCRVGVCRGV